MERVKVGIPGFSKLVPNGIEKGITILLSGMCGTGKTTLGLQYIHDGAKKGERARAIEILKLRGTEHATKIVPFKIVNKRGIEIYPAKKINL